MFWCDFWDFGIARPLSDGTDATNLPTLNLIKLQNQVLVSASIAVQFYRLKSQ
jgi:hypothetical protein